MRIRQVNVEFKICQTPDCPSPDKDRKFEGDRCPWCKVWGNPETTPRKLYRRYIAITEYELYKLQSHYKCRGKDKGKNKSDKYYENVCEKSSCPICKSELNSHRPIKVWVRTFNECMSSDELEKKDRFLSEQDGSFMITMEYGQPDGLEDGLIEEEGTEDYIYNENIGTFGADHVGK